MSEQMNMQKVIWILNRAYTCAIINSPEYTETDLDEALNAQQFLENEMKNQTDSVSIIRGWLEKECDKIKELSSSPVDAGYLHCCIETIDFIDSLEDK
jgi:hypothetical protein